VLTSLILDKGSDVKSKIVVVTFDLFEPKITEIKGVENDYEAFVVPCDWRENAAQSELISAMREFREVVKQMQEEALR
jgi:hypothetical protein